MRCTWRVVFAIVLAVLVLLAIAQAVRMAVKGDAQPFLLLVAGVILLGGLAFLYQGF